MDYFTLFGLPAQYPIDLQALTIRFQDLQRQYHPDKFASGTQAEQLAAVSHSATINQPGNAASSAGACRISALAPRF
jgi:DnaJ-domain-containing proteins 1